MTKTIPQLDPADLPVDLASLMEISIPGGGSRKLELDGFAAASKTIQITTGASPVDVDIDSLGNWWNLNVEVTSGGTAGVEILHFVGPAAGAPTNSIVGRTINVVFVVQTDPSDIINITQNEDGDTFCCIDTLGNTVGFFDHVPFDEVGNNIGFGFNGDIIQQYAWNCLYGAWNCNIDIQGRRDPLPDGGAYGALPYAQGDGSAAWSGSPITPFRILNAGSVAGLAGYPAVTYPFGMAVVFDADTPVVGSVVTGGGASVCVVISNGTDYIVMFIFP